MTETGGSGAVRDLIYDVGLNRGQDTACYLALGYRVVAFEANPDLVEHCRDRFERAIAEGRLTIVEGAISDAEVPEVAFYRYPGETWNGADVSVIGSIYENWLPHPAARARLERITVPNIDFGACLDRYGTPYYMKIDIEGADRLCLRALERARSRPTYLSTEGEQHDYSRLVADLDLLERLGYHEFKVVQQDGIGGREATLRSLSGDRVRFRFEWGSSGPFGSDLPGRWISRRAAERRYRCALRLRRARVALRGTPRRRNLAQRLYRFHPRLRGGYHDTHARLDDRSVRTA